MGAGTMTGHIRPNNRPNNRPKAEQSVTDGRLSRDEVIALARQAGLLDKVDLSEDYFIPAEASLEEIEKFAALIAAAEREACAKVCEDYTDRYAGCEDEGHGYEIAAAIRARGDK